MDYVFLDCINKMCDVGRLCRDARARRVDSPPAEKLGFGLSPEGGQELGRWKPVELGGSYVFAKKGAKPCARVGDEDKMSRGRGSKEHGTDN